MRLRPWPVLVGVLAAAGLVLRLVLLDGRWGTVDSDEAVVGLMARAMRDGSWRAFYWGQHYAGTTETVLVALLGASRWALKLVPVGLCAVSALLTWRVATRFVPSRVAQCAGLLVWLGPGAYVWWSLKERGFYWASMVLGLLLVLFAQRVVERGGRPLDWAAVGLAFGLGWWTSPTVAYFVAPAAVWLVARRRPWPLLRWLPFGVAAALVGALPWLWHNLDAGSWPSLESPPQPETVSYGTGLGRLAWHVLPMALNLRVPIDGSWVAPVVGVALYVGVLVLVAVRRPPQLVALGLVAFPFLYAVFPGRWFVGEGRYALFVLPWFALGLAWAVRSRPWVLLGACVAWLGLSLVGLDHIGAESPEHVGGDLAALERAGVDHVWADYWFAYRLAFLSDGWLVASSHQSSRERSVHDAVARDATPAFLYARGDRRWVGLGSELDARGLRHRRVRTPHFDVVLVDGRVDPASLPKGLTP